MAIDIFSIEPNVVSKDLREKIIFFYGDKKSGKTSNACRFNKPILLAFEKGFNAINGVKALPILKWSDFKTALKQLSLPKAKEVYETAIVDTADIAYTLCEKYILEREGVDKIGDIPYGGGYAMVEKEFDECLRQIVILGYGLVIISHAEEKEITNEKGEKFNKIGPTLNKRADKVVSRMADIIGYSRIIDTDEGTKTFLFMRGTQRFEAGSRWKHTPSKIEFTYSNLVNAISDAIEKQADEDGVEAVESKESVYVDENVLDYDTVKNTISELCSAIMTLGENAPKITEIVENHLGKGKKVKDSTKEQVNLLGLIADDLTDLKKELESK